MTVIVGIDEAGLGPTLGPLVISAAAFELDRTDIDINTVGEVFRDTRQQTPQIADSKKIYSSAKGLKDVEACLAPLFLEIMGGFPADTGKLISSLTGVGPEELFAGSPWFSSCDLGLPVDAEGLDLREYPDPCQNGITRIKAFSRVINAPRFNTYLRQGFNKGSLVFMNVSRLIRKVIESFPGRHIRIVVDRLGGRKFYKRYLMEQFPEWRISTCSENDKTSVYSMKKNGLGIELCFAVKADESEIPASFSSLISKYIRELTMILFNRYFSSTVPGVKPTSGYPEDAKRFLKDIKGAVPPEQISSLVRRK